MYTKIRTKNGDELNVTTQQYIVGTYVIINNDPACQFGVKTEENKYHLDIRKRALKNGDTISGGSIIMIEGKKIPENVNTFN